MAGDNPLLLNQTEAAKYLGINVRRFRRICEAGNGPRVWNPDGGRTLYAVAVLDEWAAGRDDRKRGAA